MNRLRQYAAWMVILTLLVASNVRGQTEKPIYDFPLDQSEWHPTEELIAIYDTEEIVIVNGTLQEVIRLVPQSPIGDLQLTGIIDVMWSPDGTSLAASASFANSTRDIGDFRTVIWDRFTWQVKHQIPESGSLLNWSPNSHYIAASGIIFNSDTGEQIIDLGASPQQTWNPGDINEFVKGFRGLVQIDNPLTGNLVRELTGYDGSAVKPTYSPNGELLALLRLGEYGEPVFFDIIETQNYTVISTVSQEILFEGEVVQWIGNEIVTTEALGRNILRWDAQTGELELGIPVAEAARSDWSSDGSKVFVRASNFRNEYDAALILDGVTGEVLVEVRENTDPVVRTMVFIDLTSNEIISASPGPIMSLNLGEISTASYAIRAYTSPQTVGSVAFDLDGAVTIDNTAPYTAPVPGPGEYTLTVTPYSGPDGTGTAGVSLTHTLNVTDSGNE